MKPKMFDTGIFHRHTSFDLPTYRYVPSFGKHPNNNTGIKHLPDLPKTDIRFSAKNWYKSAHYLYAIDLFNSVYYWEVHEVLEGLWLETGKDSDEGLFLKGIIQIAVALLKKIEGNKSGLIRLTEKAIPKLNLQSGIYLGIDIDDFIKKHNLFIDGKIQEQPVISLLFS